jgi:hypothetical protein
MRFELAATVAVAAGVVESDPAATNRALDSSGVRKTVEERSRLGEAACFESATARSRRICGSCATVDDTSSGTLVNAKSRTTGNFMCGKALITLIGSVVNGWQQKTLCRLLALTQA